VIVLDTHAWLWWTSAPPKLSRTAREAIESSDRLGVSPISCLEIATLARRGRITLDREAHAWVEQALARERVETIQLTRQIAVTAGALENRFPGDPADRLIYATAISAGAELVTKDAALRRFDPLRTVW
jgi:PIN domain nuclease of toxin-antitoxin system